MKSHFIIFLLCFEVGAQPPEDMLNTPSRPTVDVAISAPVVSHSDAHFNAHFNANVNDGDIVFAYVPLVTLSQQLDGLAGERPCIVERELSSFCCISTICEHVFSGSLTDLCSTIGASGVHTCSSHFDVDSALGNWEDHMDGIRAVQTTRGSTVSFNSTGISPSNSKAPSPCVTLLCVWAAMNS